MNEPTITVVPTVVLRYVQGCTQVAALDLEEGWALLVFGNPDRAGEFLTRAAADQYPLSGGWRATTLDHNELWSLCEDHGLDYVALYGVDDPEALDLMEASGFVEILTAAS